MNTRISFSQNANGRLFADTFSDVRLYDAERFVTGARMDVYLKGMQMGTVEVVAVRPFLYKQITDILGFLICGKPAAYLAAILKNYYDGEEDLKPDTQLHHLVLMWTSRNIEAHAHQLTEWWSLTRHQQEHSPTQKATI